MIDYVPYLEKGNTPDTIVQDEYIQDGPKNADGTYMGSITLRTAVSLSRNTVAWNVLKNLHLRLAVHIFSIRDFIKYGWIKNTMRLP
ncbi:MAG: hypothetical protein V8S21_03950 [Lachnospira eligens]